MNSMNHTVPVAVTHAWTLPFVHRLGDGKDDAGGLTSAYSLLEDREDADDFGDFIQDMLQQLYSEETPLLPSLYASTEILVSETRTMDVIEDHFFSWETDTSQSGGGQLPKALQELQGHIAQVKSPSHPLPFSLVKADFKLVLPMTKKQTHSLSE
ncbi:hypothetical protein BGZ65_006071 [Modicella reniformis]|uniref:Uncharacterized protein n=1 Tax=Modicella reniformis TaxID=1440133 RepID=A0A9P6ST71_9FUNG|nr:hypothetical protein BGZ65_006071 [Modicella reniformis]